MKREWVNHCIMWALCLTVIVVGIESYVRIVVDDGMQFDLEMWKYARDIKTVSPNPLIGHRHAAHRAARLMGVDLVTNSAGLRDDREIAYERQPGVLRVLMLGDSLTEGWGVSLESTFSQRIERMYLERGITAEVINAGVGNYNTIQEVESFLTALYKFHPDIVVLNYFINDAEPVPRAHAPGIIESRCYSCVFVAGRIDVLLREFSEHKNWADYYLDLYGNGTAKGWLDVKRAIKRLAEYCKEHEVKLLIANLPELHDVQDYRFQTVTELVRGAANENGVAFVDILPKLKGQESPKLWVTPVDPHPNAYANQFIAEGIFEALQSLGSKISDLKQRRKASQ
jgi:lysophospholipase L1-like esterase